MARLVVLVLFIGVVALAWYHGRRYLQLLRDKEREQQLAYDALRRADQFDALPGSSPGNPLGIPTPSVVEVKAESIRCPVCDKPFSVHQHRAETIGGVNLRIADVRCGDCGSEREIYFQLMQ